VLQKKNIGSPALEPWSNIFKQLLLLNALSEGICVFLHSILK